MEESDAPDVASGISEELVQEIRAQLAILDSARNLIRQTLQHRELDSNNEKEHVENGWVYNMKGLEDWIHNYTERRKLHCPTCREDKAFSCTTCHNEAKYHDEL